MDLAASLEDLNASALSLTETALSIMRAAGGDFFPLDFLALAAVNRTLHLIPAFTQAVDSRNFFVVAPLLRIHLDSCLRFSAAWLVDEPHGYASSVLDGVPTYKLCDTAKRRMTDTHLVQQLSSKYQWMPAVYEKCSGFVHLSRSHIQPMLSASPSRPGDTEDAKRFRIAIGVGSVKLSDKRYLEAVEGFQAVTNALQYFLDGWLFTKDNAALVKG